MNFTSRKPREISQLRTDYAPPDSPEQAVARLHRVIKEMPPPGQLMIECDYDRYCWDKRCLEAGHCVAGLKPESEVMPSQRGEHPLLSPDDTRPLSATGADRLNPLNEIAVLMRSLTWREMMDLSEAWNTPADTLWKWSKERGKE